MRKSAAITLAVVGTVAAVAVIALSEVPASTNLFKMEVTQENIAFANYLAKFGKSYGTKEEFQFRYEQYKKNMAKVAQYNSQNGNSFRLGVNKFTDYTKEEYKRLLGYKPTQHKSLEANQLSVKDLPDSVDWKSKGAVTPVKDQSHCGSCWAFSATGAIEGRYQISNGQLVSLSEQQLVDCNRGGDNNGCQGGEMYLAFDYAKDNALVVEEDYPYKATDQECQYDTSKGRVKTSGFKRVEKNSVEQLMAAIAEGPVSVAIQADCDYFQAYGGGILDKDCGQTLDHGVLAVGYGVDEASNKWYYIVKNSWGSLWGDSGYIKVAAQDGPGVLGIQMDAVFPIVEKQ